MSSSPANIETGADPGATRRRRRPKIARLSRAGSTSCSSAATPARVRAASAVDEDAAPCSTTSTCCMHVAAGPDERGRRQHPARHGRAASRQCENGGPRAGPADQHDALLRRPRLHRRRPCENLTGLDIQFAGLITFNGVIAMSNAVGGVDVCIDRPDRRPVHRPQPPGGRHLHARRASTLSRSSARATASATAATSAASARSRCSCRRSCARSRATTRSPTSTKLYGIAQRGDAEHHAVGELRQPRHPGLDRARAQGHPAREHRLRAVPEHDRRHGHLRRQGAADHGAGRRAVRLRSRPTSRSCSTRTRSAARTAARRSTRTRRRRRPRPRRRPTRRPTPTRPSPRRRCRCSSGCQGPDGGAAHLLGRPTTSAPVDGVVGRAGASGYDG